MASKSHKLKLIVVFHVLSFELTKLFHVRRIHFYSSWTRHIFCAEATLVKGIAKVATSAVARLISCLLHWQANKVAKGSLVLFYSLAQLYKCMEVGNCNYMQKIYAWSVAVKYADFGKTVPLVREKVRFFSHLVTSFWKLSFWAFWLRKKGSGLRVCVLRSGRADECAWNIWRSRNARQAQGSSVARRIKLIVDDRDIWHYSFFMRRSPLAFWKLGTAVR